MHCDSWCRNDYRIWRVFCYNYLVFSNPKENIEQFGLSDGMIVADLGAGSGFYALEAGRAVAPMGKVYAVDIQKDLLDRLKNEAHHARVNNVEIISGDVEKIGGTKIREGSVDRVIAANILFMLADKKNFVGEIKRILKNRGTVLLVDWAGSFSQMGPHPDHVVYKDKAVQLFVDAGFKVEKEIRAGSHHYGIVFRKV